MDDLTVSIDLSQFEDLMDKLPEQVAGPIMRKALKAAAEEIRKPMEALAPERTDTPTPNGDSLPPGVLKADITSRIGLQPDGGIARIGPSRDTQHVARWINNGWMLTSHKGKKIKHIPGKHFVESAADEGAQKAVDVFAEVLKTELDQIKGA